MARFVIVPQWQGSPSSRAMQLIDGAQAIAGDLPRAACTTVDIPLEAGEAVGTGVHRFSTLRRTRELVDLELAPISDPVMLIGGDCGVAVGAVGHAARRHPGLAVVWLDAHPDLHTPGSSPSGAFSGMTLRAILGEGADGLTLDGAAVTADRLVLAGAREYDPAEEAVVTDLGLTTLDARALSDSDALAAAVAATGAPAVYIHVDLDVLDPSSMSGVTASVPFGVSLADLLASIGRVRATLPLAGSSITGFAPPSPAAAVDDLGTILRIVGALA
ncbi:arginase [Microbacterium sp. cf046]|uniref:arginase family protein n=1 Tax=Microbacterium sp. cf046 TaxID=1761803 RepID=UPI0008EA1EAD|nr:arginase family protein [Microbacterium sp. cf046]SFS00025.1 arginase [Microbacterium sp. cf046]